MSNTSRPSSHKLSLLVLCGALSRATAAAAHVPSSADGAVGPAPAPHVASAGQVAASLEGRFLIGGPDGGYSPLSHQAPIGSGLAVQRAISAFTPRLAGDVFVLEHVSVGGAIDYAETTVATPLGSDPLDDRTSTESLRRVRLAPRVGVWFSSPSGLGFWGRGGLELGHWWMSDSTSTPRTVGRAETLAVALEGNVTFTPTDRLLVTAGPWVAQHVASTANGGSRAHPSESVPEYGLSLGAGLLL